MLGDRAGAGFGGEGVYGVQPQLLLALAEQVAEGVHVVGYIDG